MEKLNTLFTMIHDYLLVYLPIERKMSPNTIRAYKKSLELLLDYVRDVLDISYRDINFETINKDIITSFLLYLEETRNCSVTTRNQRLQCLRSFFNYVAQNDVACVKYYDEIKKIKQAKEEKTIVEHMSEVAVEAVLNAPDTDTDLGKRDAFMMLFLYKTGARVQELVDVCLSDIQLGTQAKVTLHGKGAKTRVVPLRENEVLHLKEYLALFHPDSSLYSNDYLFYTVRGHKRKRMTEDNVRNRVKKYGDMARKKCKEVPENVHPHLFRHSLAMVLYQNGVDLTLISQWLGHSKVETTMIYAHADTELKRQAMAKAVPEGSSLQEHLNPERYKISDEELLKRLIGLH